LDDGKKSTERRSVDSLGLAQFNVQDSGFQRYDSPLYDFLATDNYSAFMKYNDERPFMQWLDKTLARMRDLRGLGCTVSSSGSIPTLSTPT
jgi:hypothetical protein